jgi:hypothetical protein
MNKKQKKMMWNILIAIPVLLFLLYKFMPLKFQQVKTLSSKLTAPLSAITNLFVPVKSSVVAINTPIQNTVLQVKDVLINDEPLYTKPQLTNIKPFSYKEPVDILMANKLLSQSSDVIA